jgi:hypothetical protein
MSKSVSKPPFLPPRFFRAWWFFAGIALGLALMSMLGRRAGKTDYHPEFVRFFPAISPEANYFPTIDEMCAIVRARCRPDQVLVIVGGNSVLQGVAQPVDRIWSKKLQELLGDRYCVINFALRGATPADGGAVIADVLRDEFPRQIYIANERVLTGIFPLGNDVYRPIFWQAYFAGRLLKDRPRERRVHEYMIQRDHWGIVPEIVGTGLLDRALRFKDYWNRTAFEHLNTVPSLYAPAPPALFSPRKLFVDQERDGAGFSLDERYLPSAREIEMTILRGASAPFYDLNEQKNWQLKTAARTQLESRYGEAFPARFKARTLLLIGRDSVFYRRQLSAEEHARDEQAIADTIQLLRKGGYASLDYGTDFTETDYADRIHLAPSGGEKLAARVAPEVSRLAADLGYLK